MFPAIILLTALLIQQTPAPTPAPTPAQQPATAPAATTPAQRAPSPFPQPLFQMNDVSRSLNLAPDQINRLNTVTAQTQAAFSNQFAQAARLNNENERIAQMQTLTQRYNTAWNRAAQQILNEQQWRRYQQVGFQFGSFESLYNPDVQRQLNLTPQQIAGLREQSAWIRQQAEQINKVGATDPARGRQLFEDYSRKRQERLQNYLTPEQRRVWANLTGAPYRFQVSF